MGLPAVPLAAARKQHEAMEQRLATAGLGSPEPSKDGRPMVVHMPLTPSPEGLGPLSRLQQSAVAVASLQVAAPAESLVVYRA